MPDDYRTIGGKKYKTYSYTTTKAEAKKDVRKLKKKGKPARIARLNEGGWKYGVYTQKKCK